MIWRYLLVPDGVFVPVLGGGLLVPPRGGGGKGGGLLVPPRGGGGGVLVPMIGGGLFVPMLGGRFVQTGGGLLVPPGGGKWGGVLVPPEGGGVLVTVMVGGVFVPGFPGEPPEPEPGRGVMARTEAHTAMPAMMATANLVSVFIRMCVFFSCLVGRFKF